MITIRYSTKTNAKHVILPARGLVDVILRAVRARRVRWNHVVVFRDVNGWGVLLGNAEWVPAGECYIND